jgi:hypothetical protein
MFGRESKQDSEASHDVRRGSRPQLGQVARKRLPKELQDIVDKEEREESIYEELWDGT